MHKWSVLICRFVMIETPCCIILKISKLILLEYPTERQLDKANCIDGEAPFLDLSIAMA